MTYGSKAYSDLDLVVRGSNPAGFIAPVKEAVQRLGAGRPVHDVRLLSDYVAAASADTRFALFVLGAFALLAVTLTIIGVHAVVAYATAQRRREIALRLALGADRRRIVSLVVRQGALWVVGGLIVGVVGARLLTGYVAGLLLDRHRADRDRDSCPESRAHRSDVVAEGGVGPGRTRGSGLGTRIRDAGPAIEDQRPGTMDQRPATPMRTCPASA
jgi:ABC-type antimicrobial peptide transport system permease subunit